MADPSYSVSLTTDLQSGAGRVEVTAWVDPSKLSDTDLEFLGSMFNDLRRYGMELNHYDQTRA